ncbi:hypothetical protein ACFYTQ_05820 [Nocardia sp. NPDC004068]|uniref:hypothetical protein n=1 Tax=Nocardia sp. NPDC004068 TaxID=3364303 RepID=UPI003681EF31
MKVSTDTILGCAGLRERMIRSGSTEPVRAQQVRERHPAASQPPRVHDRRGRRIDARGIDGVGQDVHDGDNVLGDARGQQIAEFGVGVETVDGELGLADQFGGDGLAMRLQRPPQPCQGFECHGAPPFHCPTSPNSGCEYNAYGCQRRAAVEPNSLWHLALRHARALRVAAHDQRGA